MTEHMAEQQIVIIGGSEGIGFAVAKAARALGAEQQDLRPRPIVRRRASYQRSVYGQGFEEIRRYGRLGFWSFQWARR